jgi:hypothetical protein
MKTRQELNNSFEATRRMVIAKHQETGVYVDGFYTEFFDISKSGRSYKMQYKDRYIYVPCSACTTDGNGYLFVPFEAVERALRFVNEKGIYEYVGS